MSAIQPRVLAWARETAGLSLGQAADVLGLNASKGKTPAERLTALEEGVDEPTRPLLLKMAKTYRRPLLTFYLAEPPRMGDLGQDFRALPHHDRNRPTVDALVRDIKARQGLVRSMLEDVDAEPLSFVASANPRIAPAALAQQIVTKLDFSRHQFRAARNVELAFEYLRGRIENAGVFVLLLGNLGSHHTNIAVHLFRGFALADAIAPMIVINDQDAKAAWSFTAIHELTHLWLGQTGISGTDAENTVERYCNDVAGELLLPENELEVFGPIAAERSFQRLVAEITAFADRNRVSRTMTAYRLRRTGYLTQPVWLQLQAHFATEWAQFRQREAARFKASENGPSYYVVRRHRVGHALLGLVRRSLDEGTITYTKAGRVLGVKPRNVEPLLSAGRKTEA
ncbi:MAG: ImmA/IrrE family metallo-endopeptidase [Bryobacterales bacterium]|nr:ImmA/IrrE family metallo-endopeptidase [Bryobacterales bacterium]